MLHLNDRAAMARALALDLDPRLHDLLAARIAALRTPFGDLADDTEYLVAEPGDLDENVAATLGYTPLIDPDGVRFGDPAFRPHWDWLALADGWYELIATFGGAFAYVILVPDDDRAPAALIELCRRYAGEEN